MTASTGNEQLYLRFAKIFNDRDYDLLDEVMAREFVDHHPGLVDVTSLAVYRDNLRAVIGALEMTATPEDVAAADDRVFTRVRLTGRHVGTFLGVAPTGNPLSWYTHELWRVEDGKLAERWAVDDLVTLMGQLGVPLPTWSEVTR